MPSNFPFTFGNHGLPNQEVIEELMPQCVPVGTLPSPIIHKDNSRGGFTQNIEHPNLFVHLKPIVFGGDVWECNQDIVDTFLTKWKALH